MLFIKQREYARRKIQQIYINIHKTEQRMEETKGLNTRES